MTSIDPMAASWDGVSPYAGMVNNPVSYVDPDGRNPLLIGTMIGGVAGFGIGYASGLRGNELLASTLGGMALGAGVGFGVNGGFAGFGQGLGSVAGQVSGAASNLARRVFSGIGPTVGKGVATQAASSIIAGPITEPGVLVDDYGLTHLDYGDAYQPSRYAGMNTMQYHQAKNSDAFWNDPVTQTAIDILTTPLPVPKLGMGKMVMKGVSRVPRLLSQFSRFPNAAKKFTKHAKDFTSISDVNVYYKRAISLADSKVGGNVLGFTSNSGWTFRMNSRTGEFLTVNPNGQITTFYRRLNDPMKYWADQVSKYGK